MKRGQVALEFLTTYGWAIMVVLVAIGALAYFGTFSPGKYVADRCLFAEPFTCVDFIVRDEAELFGRKRIDLHIVLQNTGGETIHFPCRNAPGCEDGGLHAWTDDAYSEADGEYCYEEDSGGNPVVYPRNMAPGEQWNVICDDIAAEAFVGDQVKVRLEFLYRVGSGLLDHNSVGEITTVVQG